MLARWLNQKALVAVAAIVIATAGTILGLVLTGNSGASTPARHAPAAGR
jgi:hypothetical protein